MINETVSSDAVVRVLEDETISDTTIGVVDQLSTKHINVRISMDEMFAFVELAKPEGDEHYDTEEVVEMLRRKNVHYGIDLAAIQSMTDADVFDQEFIAAKGKPQVDGVDGFFEFFFNTDFSHKPKVRDDGTVDYWDIHVVEMVHEGQVIACYHEPTLGVNGMAVNNKTKIAKRGRTLPPLTGRGFVRSEDGLVYTSEITGKIDKNGNRIQISPVYEVKGDVDMNTGNIEFRGDVVVHGDVDAGMRIQATGSVSVDGVVEAAEIDAGKDVLIRAGVIGGNRARIQTKGNLIVQFMEFASADIEGNLMADSLLNCNVVCNNMITMKGKHASIVGGVVSAISGIEVMNLGNQSELVTDIHVGVKREVLENILMLQSLLFDEREELEQINREMVDIQNTGVTGVNANQDPRRVQLLRERVQKSAEITKNLDEMSRLETLVERGKQAYVEAYRNIYRGVTVSIGANYATVHEPVNSVRFCVQNQNVVMVSLMNPGNQG